LQKKYQDIISLENLFTAWEEFIIGKRKKQDVQEFSLSLTDNLIELHSELSSYAYQHGGYKALTFLTRSPATFTKRWLEIEFYTTLFIGNYILPLIGLLLPIHSSVV